MNRSAQPSGCCGKIGYANARDARKARDSFKQRRGADSRTQTNVYYCETCSLYHFGRMRSFRPAAAKSRRCFGVADPEPAL